jgi:hypothetical protein
MSEHEPVRLVEMSSSGVARRLLELGREETASPKLQSVLLRASLESLSSAPSVSATAGVASWKVVTVVAAVLGAGASTWAWTETREGNHPADSQPAAQAVRVKAAHTQELRRTQGSAMPAAGDEVVSENGLAPLDAAPARRRAEPASRRSEHAPDELAQEIARMDRARRLLDAGDAGAALQALDSSRFRVLVPEALALRVQALASAGRRTEAAELAAEFLRRYPKSPIAGRVSAALRGTSGGAQTRARD